MEKNIHILDPIKHNPWSSTREPVETVWSLCVLCQKETKIRLTFPDGRKGIQSGYDVLERKILEFQKLNALPNNLDINRINDGSGISQTLQKNNAGWHKNCYLAYSEVKLERAKEKKRTIEEDGTDCPSPVKTRRDISPLPTTNKNICFFCEKPGENLIKAETPNIDKRVRSYAEGLGDRKLIAKLSAGDMVAIDAMYHLKCLTKLGNNHRSLERRNKKGKTQNYNTSHDALVFAEIVAYIEEQKQVLDCIPIFYLRKLSNMYVYRLAELKKMNICDITSNTTRLKKKLLEHIPGLRAEKKGKHVILIFSKDVGSTIQRAINNDDMDEDEINLSKAARIVRKDIFSKSYDFSGSFEKNCERNAVSKSLLALIRMILEGPIIEDQKRNTKRDHICGND